MLELGSSQLIIARLSSSERVLHLRKGSPSGTLQLISFSIAKGRYMGSLSLGKITLRDKGYSLADGVASEIIMEENRGGVGARGGGGGESTTSLSETDSTTTSSEACVC